MHIEEKPLSHWIEHFYGYGSWEAKFWFIAYEEGGGDLPEEVAEKLNYFMKAHGPATPETLCDMREMYRHVTFRIEGPRAQVFSTLYDYRFDKNAILHGIWKNLIAFVHGYENNVLPDLLTYQKKSFALQREAVIPLYPLPAPHNHAWYYSWLDLPQFGFLKSRALYQEHVYQNRVQHVLTRMREHKPEVVLMFGMDNINTLKKSVQEFYPGAKFTMEKAIKREIPQHHRAELDETVLLITTQTPALRHNRIETGFDWEAFGKIVNASRH